MKLDLFVEMLKELSGQNYKVNYDPKTAKELAIVDAKISEAKTQTDDFWRSDLASKVARYAKDKNDTVKQHAIEGLVEVMNGTNDWFWRSQIMRSIDRLS